MSFQERAGHCSHCEKDVLIRRNTPNHLLHLILTMCTLGMWSVVWALRNLFPPAWRCAECGARARRRDFFGRLGTVGMLLMILAIGIVAIALIGRPEAPAPSPIDDPPAGEAPESSPVAAEPEAPAHPRHIAMVVLVQDGDTLKVMIDGEADWIRLRNLDAPERGQDGYAEATARLKSRFPPGCKVRLTEYARDAYGRMIATVERSR